MHPTHLKSRDERGDSTRRALLEAALVAFARDGFDNVSTRRLATLAGVNLAAIPYHFGSKEGLYRAVVQSLVDGMGRRVHELVDPLRRDLDAGKVGPKELPRRAGDLLSGVAHLLLGSPLAARGALFMAREQMAPTPAFDIAYQGFIKPLHETLTALVAGALGCSVDAPEAILRAHGLLGLVLAFRVAPATVSRRLGWEDYTPEHVTEVAAAVRELAVAALRPESER